MIYGYARVSTTGQSINGNSLEEQTAALRQYGCQHIVTEAFSGKTMERPQFTTLFQKLHGMLDLNSCELLRPAFPEVGILSGHSLSCLGALHDHASFVFRKGQHDGEDQIPGQGVFHQTHV